jgi:hypothetical protein
MNDSPTVDRSRLEDEANRARARLMHDIDSLEERWRGTGRRSAQAVRQSLPEVLAGGALLAAAGAGGALWYRARHHRQIRRKQLVQAAQRIWRHPEWLARQRPPSMSRALVRKVALGVAAWLATQGAKRGLQKLLLMRRSR